ncbi:synaptonemal complex protein 2-like [Mixophyes fleayi]|uniref:synaptonemal complex protein 2-like n=1 Tax=Mixophyes fleayi TaxID=3061075 RepID=UPI003F4E0A71
MENEQTLKDTSKHLFSDTDTDRGGDDSKTDISWLQDPISKKTLKIFSYSRQKQGKQPEKTLTCKATEICKQIQKQTAKPGKESCNVNADKKDAKENTMQRKLKRPQRATVKRKNYREFSNSEYESEEDPTALSRKETPKHQDGLHITKKLLSVEKEKKPKNHNYKKHRRNSPKIEDKTVTSTMSLYKKPAASVCSSPGSIELIRSEQYESDTELPSRNETIVQFSPSLSISPPQQLTPKKLLNISAAMKNKSKQWAKSSDRSARKTGKEHGVYETGQEPLSPTHRRLSLATLSPDHSTVSGVNILEIPEDEYNEQHLNTSSPATGKTGIQTHQKKKGNRCASFRSKSSVRCASTHVNTHESGPTLNNTMSYLKHLNNGSSQLQDIGTEGSSYEVKRKKIKLLPRRLFSSTDKKKPRESLSTVSVYDLSTVDIDTRDGSDSNINMMCQKISKECTRKIQNRSRKMDCFTKESLKSAQKHLTSMDSQVKECRIMHLEKFQQTVLEEIENFQNDSQTLKQMEKEFTKFWSQQTQVLSFYHKNEQRRIHCLKASFEKNVSHSTDYEDKIFNAEMLILKENMKTVQERLLKEMQEEELLSVQKGLHSLFMTGTGPF